MTYDVLALADYYPPATRGGALHSLLNAIEAGSGRCRFHVLTRDHDPWTSERYDVPSDVWTEYGAARVQYLSRRRLTMKTILRAARDVGARAIYMNSLFSTPAQLALWARRLGRHDLPLLLGPEGELAPGKMHYRRAKKVAYLALAEAAGIYGPVRFRAGSALEVNDIRRRFPRAEVWTAENPARRDRPARSLKHPAKHPGAAKLLFLSRIHPTKNILHVLDTVSRLRGNVELTIVGPQEDLAYWKECMKRIATLPSHVTVRYAGPVNPDEVWAQYASNHFFIFPTVGENHGYVIEEALATGTPVAISPETPWGERLGDGGRVIPLEDRDRWVREVQAFVDTGQEEYDALCAAAAAVVPYASATLEELLVRLIESEERA